MRKLTLIPLLLLFGLMLFILFMQRQDIIRFSESNARLLSIKKIHESTIDSLTKKYEGQRFDSLPKLRYIDRWSFASDHVWTIYCDTTAADKNGDLTAARVWKLWEFGIEPNRPDCYTDKVQQLIDSAYHLPGITEFRIKNGAYHFTTLTDMTKDRSSAWWALTILGGPNTSWDYFQNKCIEENNL